MRGRRILIAGVVLSAVVATVGVDLYRDYRTDRDVDRLRDMLDAGSAAHPWYDHLRAVRADSPQVWIFGTVNSKEQLDELRDAVATLFGHAEATRIVSQVHLPNEAGPLNAAPKLPATTAAATAATTAASKPTTPP